LKEELLSERKLLDEESKDKDNEEKVNEPLTQLIIDGMINAKPIS
jgi:hypothetical protein